MPISTISSITISQPLKVIKSIKSSLINLDHFIYRPTPSYKYRLSGIIGSIALCAYFSKNSYVRLLCLGAITLIAFRALRPEPPKTLLTLPEETLSLISEGLTLREFLNLRLINKCFNAFIQSRTPEDLNSRYELLRLKGIIKTIPRQLTPSGQDPRKTQYQPVEKMNSDWLIRYQNTERCILDHTSSKKAIFHLGSSSSTEDITCLHLRDKKLAIGDSTGHISLATQDKVLKFQASFYSITFLQLDGDRLLAPHASGVNIYQPSGDQFNCQQSFETDFSICGQINNSHMVLGHSSYINSTRASLWDINQTINPISTLQKEGRYAGTTDIQWEEDLVYLNLEPYPSLSEFYLWDTRSSQDCTLICSIDESTKERLHIFHIFHKEGNQVFFATDKGILVYDIRKGKEPEMTLNTTRPKEKVTSVQADSTKIVASTSYLDKEMGCRLGNILVWDRETLKPSSQPDRIIEHSNGISVCQFEFDRLAFANKDTPEAFVYEF
jgi:hypothetical protein